VLLVPLALATALAAAVVASPTIDVTVHGRATAERDGTVVIRGTLTCSVETIVTLEGEVVEPVGRNDVAFGTFATTAACGPTPTPWTVVVASDSEDAFRPGFATADVRAVGFDPESGIFFGVQTLVSLHLTRAPR
jgi:hypothetical protein